MTDPATTIQAATLAVNSASDLFSAVTDMIPKLITFATVIAAFLPPPEQSSLLSKLHRVINLLAFNFGQAKNAQKEGE